MKTVILIINKICTAKKKLLVLMLLACGHCRKKSLHTSVPINHFETLLLFYFVIYVMNRTVIFQTYWNTLDAERCFWYQWVRSGAGNGEPGAEREMVNPERSGKWWTRSGEIIKCSSAEGKLLVLHSAHILCRTLPHKCGFLLMTLLQDLTGFYYNIYRILLQ